MPAPLERDLLKGWTLVCHLHLCCSSGILAPDDLCLNCTQKDLGPLLYCCWNCWRVVLQGLSTFFGRHLDEPWVSEGKGLPILGPSHEAQKSCSQTSFFLTYQWSNIVHTDRGGLWPKGLAFHASACPNHRLLLFAFLTHILVALKRAPCITMTTFSLLCVCP